MRLVILGQGYSGARVAAAARLAGWQVTGVRRSPAADALGFDDPSLAEQLAAATHVLSSVPPTDAGDPVLDRFGPALAGSDAWLGYLSSTGVYGDADGAWVDETAPTGGERGARVDADRSWLALGECVFRLPGIYGPGRSALDRVRAGDARRVDLPGHVFGRIHVDDIAGAVLAGMAARWTGVVNVADDEPAEPRAVTEWACDLLGLPWPPLEPLDRAQLSPMAASFWRAHRRVSNVRLTRELGYRLQHPTFREGLAACLAEEPT